MRLLAVAVFAASLGTALAENHFPVVLLTENDVQGRAVEFVIDSELMDAQPIWTPGGEQPPISFEAATKIAIEAGKRQSPKSNGTMFHGIKLLKKEFYRKEVGKLVTWFWVFSISPMTDEHPDDSSVLPTVEPARDIVILLDGKVVDATPAK